MAFVPVLALALTLLASAASASNLTDVRVGVHGDHTRIVLETDGKAPYIVDAGEKEIIVHVDAAATAEAVTAKSPHLVFVKVEPTQIGADVRLALKQPADVKALVLTGPDRIVLDLYPRKAAPPAPLPAPELEPEAPAPAPTAEAAPAVPPEPQEAAPIVPAPSHDELAGNAELEAAAAQAETETEMAPAAEPEEAAPAEETAEAAPEPTAEAPEPIAPAPVAMNDAPQAPTTPAAPAPSSSLFGSPYPLAAAAVALLVVFVFLRRRLRSAETTARPAAGARRDEGPAPFAPSQRAVPIGGAPSGSGESLFDVESEAIGPPPKEEDASGAGLRASAPVEAGDEGDRRIAHLERRIEELMDARERLERQVAAQTEELRVQRAAIARTQRVLRTVTPPSGDDGSGSSGDPLKS